MLLRILARLLPFLAAGTIGCSGHCEVGPPIPLVSARYVARGTTRTWAESGPKSELFGAGADDVAFELDAVRGTVVVTYTLGGKKVREVWRAPR